VPRVRWVLVVAALTAGCVSSAAPLRFGDTLGFEDGPGALTEPWGGGGAGYERTLVCADAPEGACVARIESVVSPVPAGGFASVTQCVGDAGVLAGKRVRLSGLLRTEDVSGYAGFWLRVDSVAQEAPPRAFDNMEAKHLDGTTPWTRHDVTLEVPADDIGGACFGFLLGGAGRVDADDLTFEVLD